MYYNEYLVKSNRPHHVLRHRRGGWYFANPKAVKSGIRGSIETALRVDGARTPYEVYAVASAISGFPVALLRREFELLKYEQGQATPVNVMGGVLWDK